MVPQKRIRVGRYVFERAEIAMNARPDAAEPAKGRRQPSSPSMRPLIEPEAGTICARPALSQGIPANVLRSGGAYAHFRSPGGAYVHVL